MTAYYNEIDPHAAQWLRNLIAEGLIAPGDVDERSIEDVLPSELAGYTQCHFFAGIGGWSLALRLAGWPDDRPVWTGSCPCQPFSAAGARKGTDDERHLWPAFRWLIDQCRPVTVFGEQVASSDGRDWLAGVRFDLDLLGYGTGAADLCAAGLGAPHIRQRLWWVGHASSGRREVEIFQSGHGAEAAGERQADVQRGICAPGRLGDAISQRLEGHARNELHGEESRRFDSHKIGSTAPPGGDGWKSAAWLPCADGKARRIKSGLEPLAHGVSGRVGLLRGYGNAIVPQVAAAFIQAAAI